MFKHPQLYHDLMVFYKIYWQGHQHLPKAFRQTTGKTILALLTEGLGQVAAANFAGKTPKIAAWPPLICRDCAWGWKKSGPF